MEQPLLDSDDRIAQTPKAIGDLLTNMAPHPNNKVAIPRLKQTTCMDTFRSQLVSAANLSTPTWIRTTAP
jgi:hypothetical protein